MNTQEPMFELIDVVRVEPRVNRSIIVPLVGRGLTTDGRVSWRAPVDTIV